MIFIVRVNLDILTVNVRIVNPTGRLCILMHNLGSNFQGVPPRGAGAGCAGLRFAPVLRTSPCGLTLSIPHAGAPQKLGT